MMLDILYEDNHLIAINKAPAEIVQGDKTGDVPLTEKVKEYIKKKYNKPGDVYLGLPHRLDRPTSGIVILAKTSKALSRLNQMFQEGEIKKIYWAVVDSKPVKDKMQLVHYITRNEKQNKSYAYEKEVPDSKIAKLNYEVIASSEHYFLLEIELLTGRHHQIRAQLAAIGCRIKGDLKYGSPRSNKDASIHLHSRKAEFIHPVSKEKIEIIAKPPKDNLWKYFLITIENQIK
jgi:23S rRNA pseudouridine1911/1915/1917 synthase